MRLFKIKIVIPLVNQEAHAEAMDFLVRLQGEGLPESLNRDQFGDELRIFLVEYPHILWVDGEAWSTVDLTSTDVYELVVDFSEFRLSDYGLECLANNQNEMEYRDGLAELLRTCDDIDVHIRKIEGR